MTESTDIVEFVKYLESGDSSVVSEFKQVIHENLHSSRDATFLNALIESYVQTKSNQLLEVLAGINDSHCQYMFERMNELLKHGMYTEICSLLAAIIQKQPSWLHKIVGSIFFANYLKCLKGETDVVFAMSGAVIISMLLPCVPSLVAPFLGDIFEIFIRMSSFLVNKPGSLPDIFVLHLQIGVYILFHRLYSMYPNNFLSYMKSCFGSSTAEPVFRHVIEPMMQFVKFHSGLIIDTLKSETENSKWKTLQPHDIYAECQKISLDPLDAIKEATYSVFSQNSLSQESLYPARSLIVDTSATDTTSADIEINNSAKVSSADKRLPLDDLLKDDCQSYLFKQELSIFWSPSFSCGLCTPPSSQPISPANSMQDIPSLSEFVQRPMTPVAVAEVKDTNNTDEAFTSTPIVSRRRSGGELKKSSQKASPVPPLNLKSKSAESVEVASSIANHDKVRSEMLSSTMIGDETPLRRRKEQVQDRNSSGPKFSPMLTRSEILDYSNTKSPASAPTTPSNLAKDPFLSSPVSQLINSAQIANNKKTAHNNIVTSNTLPKESKIQKSAHQSPAADGIDFPLHGVSVSLLKVIQDLQREAIEKQRSSSTVENGAEESDRCCLRLKLKSPFELLDDFIECGANLHSLQLSRIPLTSQLDTDWTYYGGSSPADELSILKAQVSLLEVQLKYERHKCDQHVFRNRRLVGKVHKAQAVENELSGLRSQVNLLENDLCEARLALKRKEEEIRQLREFTVDMENQKSQMLQSLLEENKKLTYEIKELSDQIGVKDCDRSDLNKELKNVQHKLFEAISEVNFMKPRLEINHTVQAKAENIAKELATFQDMYERIKTQVTRYRISGREQDQLMMERDALETQARDHRAERESLIVSLESAKFRIAELEASLAKKDVAIRDQKTNMESLCHKHEQDVKVLEDRYRCLKKAIQGMESYILYLLKKLEDSGRTLHGRGHKHSDRLSSDAAPSIREPYESNIGQQCKVLHDDHQTVLSSVPSAITASEKHRVDDSGIELNEAD